MSGRRHAVAVERSCWASGQREACFPEFAFGPALRSTEAPLDESYLDLEQRSRLRETISDLLLLWDLVRPDEAKDFRRHCEALADRAESKGESDATCPAMDASRPREKLQGDRASKRAEAERNRRRGGASPAPCIRI